MMRSQNNINEKGFVLVIVLWFIALLSILTAAFSMSARSSTKLVGVELTSAKERTLLDAGVEIAVTRLAMAPKYERWVANGSNYQASIGNAKLTIQMYDQSGLIDINNSDPQLLFGLLRQFINNPKEAKKLTNKITAGRKENLDGSNSHSATNSKDGTNNSQPQQASVPKYMDVSQIQFEKGVSRKLYQEIYPYLTVHNGDGKINPIYAPRRVLMSLPNVSKNSVDDYIQAREIDQSNKNLIERFLSGVRKWIGTDARSAIEVIVALQSTTDHQSPIVSTFILPLIDKAAPYRLLRKRISPIGIEAREDIN